MKLCVTQAVIDWEAASVAAAAAVRKAVALGIRVNVAVVDSAGNLAAFLRMPGAFLPSIEIAIDKAYTAAGFGLPTGQLGEVLSCMPVAVGDGVARRPRVVLFGGGLPIRLDEQLLGAIGVSGGSEEEDLVCAQAGLQVLLL